MDPQQVRATAWRLIANQTHLQRRNQLINQEIKLMLTKGRACPRHIRRAFGALRSSSELPPIRLKFTSTPLLLCLELSGPTLAQKTNLQDLITSVIGHYFSAGSRAASPQSCGCTSLSSPQIHSFTFASGSPFDIVRILQSGQGGWRMGRRRGSESGRQEG